ESLLPVFATDRKQERTLFWEHEGNRAVRRGNYKLVALHDSPWELYDMDRDRSELNNLSRVMPGKVQELQRAYEAWARRVGAKPWNDLNAKRPKKN
ncbi:MAG: arylsulfatase, partial [Verrucomicrobiota bacterium]|nr:arylsulfatase [Verrucomicrobiota bacterium]